MLKITENRISLILSLFAVLISATSIFLQFFHHEPSLWVVGTKEYVTDENYVFELRINNTGNALATVENIRALLIPVESESEIQKNKAKGTIIWAKDIGAPLNSTNIENVPVTIKDGESKVIKIMIPSKEITEFLLQTNSSKGKFDHPVSTGGFDNVSSPISRIDSVVNKTENVGVSVQIEFFLTDQKNKRHYAKLPECFILMEKNMDREFSFIKYSNKISYSSIKTQQIL